MTESLITGFSGDFWTVRSTRPEYFISFINNPRPDPDYIEFVARLAHYAHVEVTVGFHVNDFKIFVDELKLFCDGSIEQTGLGEMDHTFGLSIVRSEEKVLIDGYIDWAEIDGFESKFNFRSTTPLMVLTLMELTNSNLLEPRIERSDSPNR